MAEFLMPALGADMTTGELVQWHVKPGDTVHRGDVVAVVETHKGAIDVEIFLDGVIDELAPLHVPLPVGAQLARVQPAAPSPDEGPLGAPRVPMPQLPKVPQVSRVSQVPQVPQVSPATAQIRPRATPAARRHAQALHLSLDGVHATGPGGAVTLADVDRAAAPPVPGRAFDPAAMRAAISTAMARSKREIPHYYLSEPVPLRRALDWLHAHNEAVPVTQRMLLAALLIKAVARAACEVPGLNGHHVEGSFRPAASVHVGVAIWLRGGGLIAPALHDVQEQPLESLMPALADLVQRARTGGLRSSELTDPTLTVTALGEEGAASVLGVIHPPQVALVGFGRVRQRAWVESGQVVPMPVAEVSLAADHRVSDGRVGSAFLAALAAQLQQPQSL
jgi:pyruvate dehydrogenase E2 component (dihydrolipoamide acetyltransferase)